MSKTGTALMINAPATVAPAPPLWVPPTLGGCDCGITDTFTRTTASPNGLGVSDSGLSWGDNGDYVDGSAGHLTAAVAGMNGLTASTPFRAQWEFTRDGAHSGGFRMGLAGPNNSCFALLDQDASGFSYGGLRLSILNFSGGGVTSQQITVPSLSAHCRMKVEVDGDTIRCKVWSFGDTEPSGWTSTLTRTTQPSFVLDKPTWEGGGWLIDNLDVTGVNRCTEYRFDNFNRTVASGWGTSDWGIVWGGVFGSPSVSGGIGKLLSGVSAASLCEASTDLNAITMVTAQDRTILARLLMPAVTGNTGSPNNYQTLFRVKDGGIYVELVVRVNAPDAGPLLRMESGYGIQSAAVSVTENIWYNLVFETNYASGHWGVKLYADGDPEPPGFLVEDTETPYDHGAASLAVQTFWNGTGNRSVEFDYIDFSYAGKPCF